MGYFLYWLFKILLSLHQLLNERMKPQQLTRKVNRIWEEPSRNYYNHPLVSEEVIWGSRTRKNRQRWRRKNLKELGGKRNFKTGSSRSRTPSMDGYGYSNTDGGDSASETDGETTGTGVQTYCILASQRNQRYPYRLRSSSKQHSYRPGYNQYIYKYYEQFSHACEFCDSYMKECKCAVLPRARK